MTLEEEIAKIFAEHDWSWSLKDQGRVIPDKDDILAALDEAARLLYDEPVGSQLEVGRLIIVKKHTGHDVYVFAGEYL